MPDSPRSSDRSSATSSSSDSNNGADTDSASHDDASTARHVRILKAGAVVYAVLGLAITGWMVDKWIRFPGQQASQLGSSAPFWPAATIFVLVSTIAGVALLWKASSRAASGENLYAQRHRKHRKDDPDF